MKKKKIIIPLVVVFVILIVAGIWIYINQDTTMKVSGEVVERTIMDRKLTIADFENIELGISYGEFEDQIGVPDDYIGYGTSHPVYFLKDGRAVVCFWGRQGLHRIEVYTKSEQHYTLKQLSQ